MPLHERQPCAYSSLLMYMDSCKIRPEHPNAAGQNCFLWTDTQKDASQIFFKDSRVTSNGGN